LTDEELLERIRELYIYREDGRLCRKSDSVHRKAGTVAGWQVTGRAYRQVRVGRKTVAEHRAIFHLHFGWLPQIVDHINGDTIDNRIENLRASTPAKNALNRKIQINNSSGCTGVVCVSKSFRWRATIQVNYNKINLGTFSSREEAIKARQDGEKRYHGILSRRGKHA